MFLGTYKHAVDDKGRFSVPRKFLEPLQDASRGRLFFGTRGFDQCLFLFLPEDWDRAANEVRQASLGDEAARSFSRQFFSMARELSVDKPGRILLPREHRELAVIENEVIIAGVDDRIELWSPRLWEDESTLGIEQYKTQAKAIFRNRET